MTMLQAMNHFDPSILSQVWPMVLTIIAGIIWGARIESRQKAVEKQLIEVKQMLEQIPEIKLDLTRVGEQCKYIVKSLDELKRKK